MSRAERAGQTPTIWDILGTGGTGRSTWSSGRSRFCILTSNGSWCPAARIAVTCDLQVLAGALKSLGDRHGKPLEERARAYIPSQQGERKLLMRVVVCCIETLLLLDYGVTSFSLFWLPVTKLIDAGAAIASPLTAARRCRWCGLRELLCLLRGRARDVFCHSHRYVCRNHRGRTAPVASGQREHLGTLLRAGCTRDSRTKRPL